MLAYVGCALFFVVSPLDEITRMNRFIFYRYVLAMEGRYARLSVLLESDLID